MNLILTGPHPNKHIATLHLVVEIWQFMLQTPPLTLGHLELSSVSMQTSGCSHLFTVVPPLFNKLVWVIQKLNLCFSGSVGFIGLQPAPLFRTMESPTPLLLTCIGLRFLALAGEDT